MMEHYNSAVPHASTAAPVDAAWSLTMGRFKTAREQELAYDRTDWRPAYEASKRHGIAIPTSIDEEMERLTEVRCEAEDMLIATPAPDLPAAIWKIKYARERWAEFSDWPDSWWVGVMEDLSRLAGTANHAFDPAAWLAEFEAVGGGFIVKPEGVQICFMLHGHPPAAQHEAKRLFDIIDTCPAKRAAVKAFVKVGCRPLGGGADERA